MTRKSQVFEISGKQIASTQGLTVWLALTILGSVMGSLQFGYCLGVVNSPEVLIKKFITDSQYRRRGVLFSESTTSNVWALIASIFAIGGAVGGFFSGPLAVRFGRKGSCLINTSLGLLASVLMCVSYWLDSFEVLVVARFLIGCHCGVYIGVVPMYLAEIGTVATRGATGAAHQVAIALGMLLAQVLGFPTLLGTSDTWNILLGLAIVPCLIQLLVLPFCPESPRFLLINREDEARCRQALTMLRGTTDVDTEIAEIQEEMRSSGKQMTKIQLLRDKSLRRPLLIAFIIYVSVQFTGMYGVFFYSTSLFREVHRSRTEASYTTSSVGCTMVIMSLLTVPFMDRLGRRTLLLIGSLGICLFEVCFTVTLVFKEKVDWFPVANIVCVILVVCFFTSGAGCVTWILGAELFSHDARPAAISVCWTANCLTSFLIGFIFPSLQKSLTNFVFLPFAAFMLLFSLFIIFFVPETKGKTFQEISEIWRPKLVPEDTKEKKNGEPCDVLA